jgi:hypothetical protein
MFAAEEGVDLDRFRLSLHPGNTAQTQERESAVA